MLLSLTHLFLYLSLSLSPAVVMHKDKEENGVLPHIHAHDGYRTRELGAFEHGLLDGDMFLQVSSNYLYIPSIVSTPPLLSLPPVLSLICLHQFCLGI